VFIGVSELWKEVAFGWVCVVLYDLVEGVLGEVEFINFELELIHNVIHFA
jgi:hypothetical protein